MNDQLPLVKFISHNLRKHDELQIVYVFCYYLWHVLKVPTLYLNEGFEVLNASQN